MLEKNISVGSLSIKYSFICPHHNNPDLLNRLINTIPQRSDIEIIVVDDNSDADKRPQLLRNDCRLVQINAEETKGPGKARNLGIEIARGEWLVFPDSDDFYEKGILEELDRAIDLKADMVFFDVRTGYDVKTSQTKMPQTYSLYISKFCKDRTNDYWLRTVKHYLQAPWNFIVRKSLVKSLNVRFKEIPKGNDAYFHHKIAMAAKNVNVINKVLYYWTWNENSITHRKRTKEEAMKSLDVQLDTTMLRIEANAWNTIPPFHKGARDIICDLGIFNTLEYFYKKLFIGIPWHKVWWHKITDYIKYC